MKPNRRSNRVVHSTWPGVQVAKSPGGQVPGRQQTARLSQDIVHCRFLLGKPYHCVTKAPESLIANLCSLLPGATSQCSVTLGDFSYYYIQLMLRTTHIVLPPYSTPSY